MKQNNFLKFFTIVFLLFGAVTISAQTIKGKVTDSSGEALSFMNVVEKELRTVLQLMRMVNFH